MENNTTKNREIYTKIINRINADQNALQRERGRADAIKAELAKYGITTKAQMEIKLRKLQSRITETQKAFDALVNKFMEKFDGKL